MSQDTRLYQSAEVWDQPMQRGQSNLLQAIRDFWPSGIASVLDVGCGDGKLSSGLMEQDALTIVGLDSSEEALSRLPFKGVKGDAQALPFAAGAFDLVMSTDALEHMPDVEEDMAWRELFRVAGKVVMVAVPFREELLDASAHCARCGQAYHVNWHQRSYDIADLHRRVPAGWHVAATVLSGEPWSAMLPPETHFRRAVLDEWGGWEAAICPTCGEAGQVSSAIQPLAPLWARTLGEQLYRALATQRYCRSHSEILVIFQRDGAGVEFPSPYLAEPFTQSAALIDFTWQQPVRDLEPFCQVARYTLAKDGQRRIQFPIYNDSSVLEVRRLSGSVGPLHLLLEDDAGCLFDGCVLEDGEQHRIHQLPRVVETGYYGALASCVSHEPYASLRLGIAPAILWASPTSAAAASYLVLESLCGPIFMQVTQPLWVDPEVLNCAPSPIAPTPAEVAAGGQACFDRSIRRAMEISASERDALLQRAAEADRLAVDVQNLGTERDALLVRLRQADEHVVQLQNLTAERDALLLRAVEADRLAVEVQNLDARCAALSEQSRQVDEQVVRLQNLTAERDALLLRAAQADRLAVDVQNLVAERDALQARSRQADEQAVQLQNLTTERDALLLRAAQVDRLAVDIQNLVAERDALQARSRQADEQAVQLQNLTAERDALLLRAAQADRLAVDIQNLVAERDALQARCRQADEQVVQLQNLTAERDALLLRAAEADRLAVDVQNLGAKCAALSAQSLLPAEQFPAKPDH